VVRFTPATDGNFVNHFPVALGLRVRINGHQFVRSIASNCGSYLS
jgi:hypothetical protein